MITTFRQVVLLTADLQPQLQSARDVLGLEPGVQDAEMAEFGLTHDVMVVGGKTYLEICAPLDLAATTTATRFLHRNGGDGGYMLAIEVSDAEEMRRRLADRGIAPIFEQNLHGNLVTQLAPKSLGTLLEADEIVVDGVDWHYDRVLDRVRTDVSTAIVAADVAVADPAAMAQLWREVFDLEDAGETADAAPNSVRTADGAVVRFVPTSGPLGVVAFDVQVADRSAAGQTHTLSGVELRLV